jgi:hypothetical protein
VPFPLIVAFVVVGVCGWVGATLILDAWIRRDRRQNLAD